jgi:hypothetical protein
MGDFAASLEGGSRRGSKCAFKRKKQRKAPGIGRKGFGERKLLGIIHLSTPE